MQHKKKQNKRAFKHLLVLTCVGLLVWLEMAELRVRVVTDCTNVRLFSCMSSHVNRQCILVDERLPDNNSNISKNNNNNTYIIAITQTAFLLCLFACEPSVHSCRWLPAITVVILVTVKIIILTIIIRRSLRECKLLTMLYRSLFPLSSPGSSTTEMQLPQSWEISNVTIHENSSQICLLLFV